MLARRKGQQPSGGTCHAGVMPLDEEAGDEPAKRTATRARAKNSPADGDSHPQSESATEQGSDAEPDPSNDPNKFDEANRRSHRDAENPAPGELPVEEVTPDETRRARLWAAANERGIPLQTIIAAVAVVVVVYLAGRLVYKLKEILLLLLVAGFVALLLNPAVVFFQRHLVKRRGGAVAIVTAFAVLVFIGLAAGFGYPLANGITHLAEKLPTYTQDAEHGRGWLGHLVIKYHIESWVKKNLAPKLTSYAQSLSKPALNLGKGAVTLLLELFAIFVLVLLLLLEAPKLRRGVLMMMRPERRDRVVHVAGEATRSVTGFMIGNFITSVIAGVVVYVTLTIFNVPFALLWALWVALVDFLPMIGGALAGIPTVIFAAFHSLSAGIATLIVFLIYTQVENHVLNPIVMSKTVRINPLVVLLAILVGANLGGLVGGFFGGFVGTLLAIPVAGSIQVIVQEVWHATAPEEEGASPGERQGVAGTKPAVMSEDPAGQDAVSEAAEPAGAEAPEPIDGQRSSLGPARRAERAR
jgi:predicted PurR-regulated permease PerM